MVGGNPTIDGELIAGSSIDILTREAIGSRGVCGRGGGEEEGKAVKMY